MMLGALPPWLEDAGKAAGVVVALLALIAALRRSPLWRPLSALGRMFSRVWTAAFGEPGVRLFAKWQGPIIQPAIDLAVNTAKDEIIDRLQTLSDRNDEQHSESAQMHQANIIRLDQIEHRLAAVEAVLHREIT